MNHQRKTAVRGESQRKINKEQAQKKGRKKDRQTETKEQRIIN